uniref:Uncharacterized protein n=1 Tax=Amphimedon queenslandica TaxID=400682 RepID=A0A1X7TDY2_AMPQE
MFQEEESELQHNPDDHDCYNRLRASNLDEHHATTPKRPKASRKMTWSQESEASAPVNSDLIYAIINADNAAVNTLFDRLIGISPQRCRSSSQNPDLILHL